MQLLTFKSVVAVHSTHVLVAAVIAIVVLLLATFTLCGFDLNVFGHLVLGKDERTSTSKFQAVVWTFAICFALVTLLIGHFLYSDFDPGWRHFVASGLNSDYIWLLGIPSVGLVGAKLVTQTQVNANPAAKTKRPADKGTGLQRRVQQLVSNDNDANPSPNLGDLQYVVFNVIAVAYFLGAFLAHVQDGLPTLPGSLIALTGVSAASYLATKTASQTAAPTITSAVPSTVVLLDNRTTKVVVSGTGFMPDGVSREPSVTVGGAKLDLHPNEPPTDTRIAVDVPTAAGAKARGLAPGTHTLVVVSSAGTPSTTHIPFVVSVRDGA
jgi:hypothetical protein